MVIYILSAALLHWEAFLGSGVSGRIEDFPFFFEKKKKRALRGVFDTILEFPLHMDVWVGRLKMLCLITNLFYLFVFLTFFLYEKKNFSRLDGHHVG